MARQFRQLSPEERAQIEALAKEGYSGKSIARKLGRAQSTICRELGRNREGDEPYGAARAQALAADRRLGASERPRKLGPEDWKRFKARLDEGWTPEQISAREKLEGRAGVSVTWLYKWIRQEAKHSPKGT